MAKAMDQFKEVQGSILVSSMMTHISMLTAIDFDHLYDNVNQW